MTVSTTALSGPAVVPVRALTFTRTVAPVANVPRENDVEVLVPATTKSGSVPTSCLRIEYEVAPATAIQLAVTTFPAPTVSATPVGAAGGVPGSTGSPGRVA